MLRVEHIFVLIAIFFVPTQAWTYNRNAGTLKEGSSCHVSPKEVGVCSYLKNCESFRTKRIRYTDLKRCTFVGINEVVCCPQLIASTTTPPLKPKNDILIRRPAKIACDAFTERNPDRIASRVFGQQLAFAGEFPHIGAMLYSSNSRYMNGCEASLISERFALTAAICVDNILPTLVRFGVTEWNPKQKKSHQVDARIKMAIKHSGYRSGLPLHDIAIIEFTEDITFSPFVSPACLQSDNKDYPSSVNLQVAGWSKFNTKTKKRNINSYLLSANVTTVELNSCIKNYRNYLQFINVLEDTNGGLYCAIDFSRDFSTDKCYGDFGGALMVDTEELWEIIGIASYVNYCGVRLPSVFIRVSAYLDWIEKIVWSPESKLRNRSYIGL